MNEEAFESFLHSIGLRPKIVAADGSWRRCPTESHPHRKNGSYKLAEDGGIGWAQDFASHTEPVTWKPGADERPVIAFDPKRLQKAHAEVRRKQVQATQAARDFCRQCKPLADWHPYLASHGLGMTGCSGLKVDRDGWLVVPAYKDRNLMTVQRISPEGEKLFWKGAPVKGASYTIDRTGATITVFCEGLATGLAIFSAAPLTRVVVAFDSGNLKEMRPPKIGMVAVAADNDHRTICQRHRSEGRQSPYKPWEDRPEWCRCNPGRCAAQIASEALGCEYALPEGIEGTDWCDYAQEKLTARLQRYYADPYARGTERDLRRAVDAEIAFAITRAARLRVGA